MKYRVRHLRPGMAAVTQEIVEADSLQQLRTRLRSAGSVVFELGELRGDPPNRGQRIDVAWWCRELETLIRAGMTAVEAIETLADGRHDAAREAVHTSLLTSLRKGSSLSKAMRASGAFPEVLVASVMASERTSTLADALKDYLRYDELLERLYRQAVSAALYPALVVGLGGLISLFLLLYVIPRFSRMYGDVDRQLSAATELVLWLSRSLHTLWPLVIGGLVLVVAGFAWVWRSGRLLQLGASLVDAVAPLRERVDQFRFAKLYQALALLVRGGYNFDEALQVALGLDLGVRVAMGLARARQLIASGKSASAAMAAGGLTETTTERLLAVGERTGAFSSVLQTVAERHSSAFTTFIERVTRIVEPLLLLAVALVVGSLVVMMYMPIFDIAGGVGSRQ